jgi:hypothetical protein
VATRAPEVLWRYYASEGTRNQSGVSMAREGADSRPTMPHGHPEQRGATCDRVWASRAQIGCCAHTLHIAGTQVSANLLRCLGSGIHAAAWHRPSRRGSRASARRLLPHSARRDETWQPATEAMRQALAHVLQGCLKVRLCRPWSSPVARKREKREVITSALAHSASGQHGKLR